MPGTESHSYGFLNAAFIFNLGNRKNHHYFQTDDDLLGSFSKKK
jgi:hypothetical protein